MTTELLDVYAEQAYDYCNAHRHDNLTKEGLPGDPRKVSAPYSTVMEPVKRFYRTVAEWHLENMPMSLH